MYLMDAFPISKLINFCDDTGTKPTAGIGCCIPFIFPSANQSSTELISTVNYQF